jgi:RNA polymerase sigma-70 factor (ECF subfamily)
MTEAISILKRHEKKLLAYIHRRCRDRFSSEDVLQETLLRIIEQSRKSQIANPVAYAYRVADSVIYAHARKGMLEIEIGDADFECEAPLADEVLEYKQRTAIFEEALLRLTPLRRDIFIRRHIEGKSRQRIAEELNLNLEAVKKHLVRAMAELTLGVSRERQRGAVDDDNKKAVI